MYPERDNREHSTKVVLIVLGIVGGVILVCGGSVVVVIIAITMLGRSASGSFTTVMKVQPATPPEAEQVVREVLADLGSGNTAAAFQKMKPAPMSPNKTEAELQALLKKRPALRNQRSYTFEVQKGGDSWATFQVKVTGMDGSTVELFIDVNETDGEWHITKFATF